MELKSAYLLTCLLLRRIVLMNQFTEKPSPTGDSIEVAAMAEWIPICRMHSYGRNPGRQHNQRLTKRPFYVNPWACESQELIAHLIGNEGIAT